MAACGPTGRGGRARGWTWGACLLAATVPPGPVAPAAAEPPAPAGAVTPAPPDQVESPVPSDATIAAGLMISPGAAARRRRAECAESGRQGEIVVCGADRGTQWRVPSTAESDPGSRQGQDNGVPQAPNVSSLPDCRIVKCHGFGKVPPPVYVVDFSKLPEAPAGSDADRIARGEAPGP